MYPFLSRRLQTKCSISRLRFTQKMYQCRVKTHFVIISVFHTPKILWNRKKAIITNVSSLTENGSAKTIVSKSILNLHTSLLHLNNILKPEKLIKWCSRKICAVHSLLVTETFFKTNLCHTIKWFWWQPAECVSAGVSVSGCQVAWDDCIGVVLEENID